MPLGHNPNIDMIESLKATYETQARAKLYKITKALWECKMAEGNLLNEDVIKIVGYG